MLKWQGQIRYLSDLLSVLSYLLTYFSNWQVFILKHWIFNLNFKRSQSFVFQYKKLTTLIDSLFGERVALNPYFLSPEPIFVNL